MSHNDPWSRVQGFARQMRSLPTEAEARLWRELRDRRLDRVKFRRQVVIGSFIVDFVCFECGLVVELDGSQHADSAYDRVRSDDLKQRGFRVLRFWNDDVLRDIDGVCATILAYARDRSLQPWR